MADEQVPRPPRKRVPPIVRSNETEKMEDLAEEAHAELPPPGHERREALKQRGENLQQRIEKIGQSIVLNNIDPKMLAIMREIQARTSYLTVSNKKEGFVYAWVSKNNWNNHRQRLEAVDRRSPLDDQRAVRGAADRDGRRDLVPAHRPADRGPPRLAVLRDPDRGDR